MYVATMVP